MARPTYTDIPDTDIDVGSPLTDTLMTELRDNIEANRIVPVSWDIASTVVTSASYVQVGTVNFIYVPSLAVYTGIARLFTGWVDVTVYSGGTSGDVRITEAVSATDGTPVNFSATGEQEPTVTIAAGWIGTVRQFEVWARKNGGGTMTLGAANTVAARMEY